MKKIFITLFLASIVSTALAQGSQKVICDPANYKEFTATIPEFQSDGKPLIYIGPNKDYEGEARKITVSLYNDDFTKIYDLSIDRLECDYMNITEEREWDDVTQKYTGDWQKNESEGKKYFKFLELHYYDFDQSCKDFRIIRFSQTLFNKDDKYEYLMPLKKAETKSSEYDRDGDGIIDVRSTYTSLSTTGFNIVSETGAILQTTNFENGFIPSSDRPHLLKINGKLYLCFFGQVDDSSAFLVYTIDSSTSSVRMMSMEKTSTPAATYNLKGQHTNGSKGINIVRMTNGTTKKIIVK